MNLNDLKHLHQARKATGAGMAPAQAGQGGQAMKGLIERLRMEEAKEARGLRKARPLWWVAAGIFCLSFVGLLCCAPAGVAAGRVWFSGVLAAVYLLIAGLVAKRLRQLSRVDYTEPLRVFLERAELRLQFMPGGYRWLAGIVLVILGVAGGFYCVDIVFVLRRYVGAGHQVSAIVVYCIGYVALCVMGFLFSYKNWKSSKAALLEQVRSLKGELAEAEESRGSEGDGTKGR